MESSLSPDLVLFNGNIICMDSANNFAQSLAVKNGKFIAISKDSENIRNLIGNNTVTTTDKIHPP